MAQLHTVPAPVSPQLLAWCSGWKSLITEEEHKMISARLFPYSSIQKAQVNGAAASSALTAAVSKGRDKWLHTTLEELLFAFIAFTLKKLLPWLKRRNFNYPWYKLCNRGKQSLRVTVLDQAKGLLCSASWLQQSGQKQISMKKPKDSAAMYDSCTGYASQCPPGMHPSVHQAFVAWDLLNQMPSQA